MPRIYTSPYPSVPLSSLGLIPFLESSPHSSAHLDIPAFKDYSSGQYYTRREIFDRSRRLGAGLRHRLHLNKGDVVLVFGRNSIDYPVIVLGIIAAGLIPCLASSAFGPTELAYQIEDSKPKVVFVDPDLLGTLKSAVKLLKGKVYAGLHGVGGDGASASANAIASDEGKEKSVLAILIQEDKTSASKIGDVQPYGHYMAEHAETEVEVTPEGVNETTLICYSSGTTGNPKGVEMTHLNLTTSVQSCGAPIRSFFRPGADWTLGYLPWYHMYGGLFVMFMSLYDAFSVIAMPKFTVRGFCDATQKYKIRFGFVVPPTLMTLIKSPEVQEYDMSSLEWLMPAAAPCKEELTKAVEKLFPGMAVCQFYGATEASPTATMLDPSDAFQHRGTVGKLLPNVEARIVDDDEHDVDEGNPGELWIRGPVIMKGYLGRPDATRDAITQEGFYKTGDVVVMKNQIIKVVDRKKELIKYKSLQVAPAELEGILMTHPEIADVGVIGVWSEKQQTELPRAYIVPVRGLEAYTDRVTKVEFARGINEWLNPKVAYYKRLVGGIVLIDVMPRLLSGKIKRRDLRERAKIDFTDVDEVRESKL